MLSNEEIVALKVDVGVLKTQVVSITQLCDKMDKVIERLVINHDRMVSQIYDDMEKRKLDTNVDVKEVHSRISTISRELSDKVELTERRIMDEIKSLRADIAEHNKKEDQELKKLLEWKWMVAGGVVALSILFSKVDMTMIGKLFS